MKYTITTTDGRRFDTDEENRVLSLIRRSMGDTFVDFEDAQTIVNPNHVVSIIKNK